MLDVDRHAFALKHGVQSAITESAPLLRELAQPLPQLRSALRSSHVALRGSTQPKQSASVSLANLMLRSPEAHDASLGLWRHHFFDSASLSIWTSSAWSATSRFRRRFSSSKLTELASVRYRHPTELRSPAVERPSRHAVLAAQVLHRRASFRLLQQPDDLLIGKPRLLHRRLQFVAERQIVRLPVD